MQSFDLPYHTLLDYSVIGGGQWVRPFSSPASTVRPVPVDHGAAGVPIRQSSMTITRITSVEPLKNHNVHVDLWVSFTQYYHVSLPDVAGTPLPYRRACQVPQEGVPPNSNYDIPPFS